MKRKSFGLGCLCSLANEPRKPTRREDSTLLIKQMTVFHLENGADVDRNSRVWVFDRYTTELSRTRQSN